MIQNQRQYNVTKGQIAKLESALQVAPESESNMDPRIYRTMVAGIQAQIRILQEQLEEFGSLSDQKMLRMNSLHDLGERLIKARVARGYTQKELAERLRVQPQQIQKYEATEYQSASFGRIIDVGAALGIEVTADIPLKPDAVTDGTTDAGDVLQDAVRHLVLTSFVVSPSALRSHDTGIDFDCVKPECDERELVAASGSGI